MKDKSPAQIKQPDFNKLIEAAVDIEVTGPPKSGEFLATMEVLSQASHLEEMRHDGIADRLFVEIYKQAFVASHCPEALTEFLRHPFWEGRPKKPSKGDTEAILRGLFQFSLRHLPQERARKQLYTKFSAGRELLARGTKPNEALAVLQSAEKGVAGLRDAFKLRRRTQPVTNDEHGSASQKSVTSFPTRLPVYSAHVIGFHRYNSGDNYLEVNIGGTTHYIAEKDIKLAKKR
ncbi:hypothetical protein [Aureimonas sp. N4]|uniref:hypothetical protein n=1 Tax=Aureimonas sp. N4 TaxID=1638165 RepID=UPI000785322E|nr:hypothetical protein [Aureimonas sp. N4]